MIEQGMQSVRKKGFILPDPNDVWYVVRKFGPGMASETLCRINKIDKAFAILKRFIALNPDAKYVHKGDNWPLGTAWISKRLGISVFLMEDVARNKNIPELPIHELLAMTREPHASVWQYGLDHLFSGTATKVEEVASVPASNADYKALVNRATAHVSRGV